MGIARPCSKHPAISALAAAIGTVIGDATAGKCVLVLALSLLSRDKGHRIMTMKAPRKVPDGRYAALMGIVAFVLVVAAFVYLVTAKRLS
jgi:hypothetical protein